MAKARLAAAKADSKKIAREIWKPVPSEPGVLASSWGRILRPPRHAVMPRGNYRLYTPRPCVGQISSAKKEAAHRLRIIMIHDPSKASGQRPRKVHQLVCEAFHGSRPSPNAVVIHTDEDSLNNRPENLRWGTQKENLNAPGFLAYCKGRTGEDSPIIKARAPVNWSGPRLIDVGGEMVRLSEACKRAGVNYGTALYRMNKGWAPDRILMPIAA